MMHSPTVDGDAGLNAMIEVESDRLDFIQVHPLEPKLLAVVNVYFVTQAPQSRVSAKLTWIQTKVVKTLRLRV